MDKESRIRYSRQIAVEAIGVEGQELLMSRSVFVVGCGALGSMVAMQLAGADVGRIGIADFDTIDISNLHRQFFFKTSESGMRKSGVLKERMTGLNSEVDVVVVDCLINERNAPQVFKDYDFIIDATDNPVSKAMIEKECHKQGKPYCIGGVEGFHGQVFTGYRSEILFLELSDGGEGQGIMPCEIGGVMGPSAAICASLQASEAVKFLKEKNPEPLANLLTFDLLNNDFRHYDLL